MSTRVIYKMMRFSQEGEISVGLLFRWERGVFKEHLIQDHQETLISPQRSWIKRQYKIGLIVGFS